MDMNQQIIELLYDTGNQRRSRGEQHQSSLLPDTPRRGETRRNSGETRRNSGESSWRNSGKIFTITEKARMVSASRERRISVKDSVNLARIAIDNAHFEACTSRQAKSTVAQLVDLEEDMANDDFDYDVFVKKEEPLQWRVYTNERKQDLDKLEGFLRLKAEPVALWNERQAREKQQKTPKSDESGLVGVWQATMSLGVTPKLSMEDAQNMSFYGKRDDTSPLPQYLFSCARHGMTNHQILRAMESLSNGRISGRFFEFYPQRRVDIRYWLAGWIKRGVVPLATLNYQKHVRGISEEERAQLPRDWHHHIVYAVSYDGIHLANPISKMKAEHFKARIESESVILIPRDEVLARLQTDLDYEQLKSIPEWKQMNVLGQIEVIEREEERYHTLRIPCGMKYIAIPSDMVGGISLFALKDTENYKAIMSSEEVFLKI